MVQRWVSAALLNAERRFRRVRGLQGMPPLNSWLQEPIWFCFHGDRLVQMGNVTPDDANGVESSGGSIGATPSPRGMSPYAMGGGGVTFERKVAVQYLTHLLVGDSATELGDGRRVLRIAFQQAPVHPVDDLVVSAACPDELQPSLTLAIAVRRMLRRDSHALLGLHETAAPVRLADTRQRPPPGARVRAWRDHRERW